MKCLGCDREAFHIYKVDFDGVEKSIAYCPGCLKRAVFGGLPTARVSTRVLFKDSFRKAKNRNLIADTFTLGMFLSSEVPLFLLESLFGSFWNSEQEKENFLNERRIAFLERKLKEAVKSEDYKRANHIKELISQIKNRSDVK